MLISEMFDIFFLNHSLWTLDSFFVNFITTFYQYTSWVLINGNIFTNLRVPARGHNVLTTSLARDRILIQNDPPYLDNADQ